MVDVVSCGEVVQGKNENFEQTGLREVKKETNIAHRYLMQAVNMRIYEGVQ